MSMLPEVHKTMRCRSRKEQLAEYFFNTGKTSAREHLAGCESCRTELKELRATTQLLDQWQAPEPNSFFLTRMEARLREEREAVPRALPVRWWLWMRARAQMGDGSGVRPLAAMAMSLLLLLGGGTYLDLTSLNPEKVSSPQAAVVQELQTMDSNAQLLDQLDAMDRNDDGDSIN